MPKLEASRAKTGGRQKGTPNKNTSLLKDAILRAAELAGGKEGLIGYLKKQALKENSGPFIALLGKVLPLQITGANGGPIKHDLSGIPDEGLDKLATILGSNPNLRGGKGRDSAAGDQT